MQFNFNSSLEMLKVFDKSWNDEKCEQKVKLIGTQEKFLAFVKQIHAIGGTIFDIPLIQFKIFIKQCDQQCINQPN